MSKKGGHISLPAGGFQNQTLLQQNQMRQNQMTSSQIGDRDMEDIQEENQGFHDYTQIKLKEGHERCPMWVSPDSRIFLEAFSPQYREATDFLIAIAEPVNRPTYIHEYILTKFSLYAAVSVGLTQNDILQRLKYFAKNEEIPADVKSEIELYCRQYGKAKLVLKEKRYFIEPNDRSTRSQLMDINSVRQANYLAKEETKRIEGETLAKNERMQNLAPEMRIRLENLLNEINNGVKVQTTKSTTAAASSIMGQSTINNAASTSQQVELVERFMNLHDEFKVFIDAENEEADYIDDEKREDMEMDEGGLSLHRTESVKHKKEDLIIEIIGSSIEQVKADCISRNFPLIEEYDFKHDVSSPEIKIEIQAQTQIRAYQEQSLSKMFSNGRARSGVIVLPCGAGKTLTGIVAACTIKKSCIILCQNLVSVEQWRQQFLKFATVGSKIVRLTSKTKDQIPYYNPDEEAVIMISTYSMISREGKRSEESEKIFNLIKSTDWGLMILDEVQVMPANMFRQVIKTCKAHCKLGLTATLVREDEKIKDLNFLIGPKLYEANWLDLQEQGFLARVQCIEVWCEMTALFYDQYLKAAPRTKTALYINNPNKFLACQYLINLHESRGDKIIVFSDNINALKSYALKLKKPFIYGEVTHQERMGILHYFQHTSEINTIFLSTVGDAAIDLPGANVIIQISSHFGARRQEAQRLGRILRPKQDSVEKQAFANSQEFNAYFYSLVSTNTQEMYYADKRQQFLVDQGFYFEVIQSLPFMHDPEEKKKLLMSESQDQTNLLNEILRQQNSGGDKPEKDEYEDDEDQRELDEQIKKERKFKMSALTGADE